MNATDKTATEDAPWIGVLKRGSTFTLGTNPDTSKRYEAGIEYPLDDATKERLEERAVDQIDTGDYDEDTGLVLTEPKCKFDFRRVGEAPAAARRRMRPTR